MGGAGGVVEEEMKGVGCVGERWWSCGGGGEDVEEVDVREEGGAGGGGHDVGGEG